MSTQEDETGADIPFRPLRELRDIDMTGRPAAALEAEFQRRKKEGFPDRLDKEGKTRGRPLSEAR